MAMMPDSAPNAPQSTYEKVQISPQSNAFTAMIFASLVVLTAATVYLCVMSQKHYGSIFGGLDTEAYRQQMTQLKTTIGESAPR